MKKGICHDLLVVLLLYTFSALHDFFNLLHIQSKSHTKFVFIIFCSLQQKHIANDKKTAVKQIDLVPKIYFTTGRFISIVHRAS